MNVFSGLFLKHDNSRDARMSKWSIRWRNSNCPPEFRLETRYSDLANYGGMVG